MQIRLLLNIEASMGGLRWIFYFQLVYRSWKYISAWTVLTIHLDDFWDFAWFSRRLALKTLDYNSTLSIVDQLLSSIPPYALYNPTTTSAEAKCMYMDRFLNSSCTTIQRAREAWLTDIVIDKCMSDILPLAIQIELYFCRADGLNFLYDKLIVSPFVCAYYLKFLCYHELGQYDNRDRELRQLIDVVYKEQCGERRDFSYNIAGHCLLVAGETDRARAMFNSSLMFRMIYVQPLEGNDNSANWYLTNFC